MTRSQRSRFADLPVRRAVRLAICVGLAFAAPAVRATEPAVGDDSDARARSLLREMAKYLVTLQSFRVEAHTTYDVVQKWGDTLEFGGIRRVEVRRPDRLRIRFDTRKGAQTELLIDGKRIVVYSRDDAAYVETPFPGSLDEALRYAVDLLNQPAPGSELLRSDFWKLANPMIQAALYVGESTIDGVLCHHLVFGGEKLDWQLWITRDGPPLPRRLVITYRASVGGPQFRASFTAWETSAELPDSVFTFTPSDGVNRIPVATKSPAEKPGEAQR